MNNLLNILKSIKNPQQAKELMLNELAKKRPDIANNLRMLMQSGARPQDALRQAIAKGQITKKDFDNMKTLLASYGRFLPFNISQQDLQEVEKEFQSSSTQMRF